MAFLFSFRAASGPTVTLRGSEVLAGMAGIGGGGRKGLSPGSSFSLLEKTSPSVLLQERVLCPLCLSDGTAKTGCSGDCGVCSQAIPSAGVGEGYCADAGPGFDSHSLLPAGGGICGIGLGSLQAKV